MNWNNTVILALAYVPIVVSAAYAKQPTQIICQGTEALTSLQTLTVTPGESRGVLESKGDNDVKMPLQCGVLDSEDTAVRSVTCFATSEAKAGVFLTVFTIPDYAAKPAMMVDSIYLEGGNPNGSAASSVLVGKMDCTYNNR